MEKFSQPHALEQELKSIGGGLPISRLLLAPHIPIWPISAFGQLLTLQRTLTSGMFIGYLLQLSSLKISLLWIHSRLTQLSQAENNFPGASLPGICLPQAQQSFSRSPIHLLSSSPQIVLKARRLEGRQRHQESFPFLAHSSSRLFLATSEAEYARWRACFVLGWQDADLFPWRAETALLFCIRRP